MSKSKKYNSSNSVIDHNGFRLNVGMIITNANGQVFWGRRHYGLGWQFPQGGMAPYETVEEAMFRELEEETSLLSDQVDILAMTNGWYFYTLPKYLRRKSRGRCIGQRQRWFLLRLKSDVVDINVGSVKHPEFSEWRWVDYWYPVREVIFFKRKVYERALSALAPYNVVNIQTRMGDDSDSKIVGL